MSRTANKPANFVLRSRSSPTGASATERSICAATAVRIWPCRAAQNDGSRVIEIVAYLPDSDAEHASQNAGAESRWRRPGTVRRSARRGEPRSSRQRAHIDGDLNTPRPHRPQGRQQKVHPERSPLSLGSPRPTRPTTCFNVPRPRGQKRITEVLCGAQQQSRAPSRVDGFKGRPKRPTGGRQSRWERGRPRRIQPSECPGRVTSQGRRQNSPDVIPSPSAASDTRDGCRTACRLAACTPGDPMPPSTAARHSANPRSCPRVIARMLHAEPARCAEVAGQRHQQVGLVMIGPR
jgi:hypothetical protein